MSDTIEMLYFLFGLGVGLGISQHTEGNSFDKIWAGILGVIFWPIYIGYSLIVVLRKKSSE